MTEDPNASTRYPGKIKPVEDAGFYPILRRFEEAGIAVLLWKGGDRLAENLSGDGDLDLLVRPDDFIRASALLEQAGFSHLENVRWRHQPFVHDWFGVDLTSGKILHIQLYEKLVLGNCFSPQIDVPGSDTLFDRAVGDVPLVAGDGDAAVLRICRAALARKLIPGRSTDSLFDEALRLMADLEASRISSSAVRLFDEGIAERITSALHDRHCLGDLRGELLTNHLSSPAAEGEKVSARLTAWVSRQNRGRWRFPVLPRRKLRPPAPVIAVIGSDGSGKSTVSRRLHEALNEKMDARFIYFGTGDGPGSLLRRPLVWLRRHSSYDNDKKANSKTAKKQPPSIAKALWAITVAWERRGKMRRAGRAARAGIMVVTDRFPQTEFPGIHDGPRLAAWLNSKKVWRRSLATWEFRIYEKLAQKPPDLVLLLDVNPELAAARRPEEPEEELQKRIKVARALSFNGARRVVIDAFLPLNEVVGIAAGEVISLIG